MSTLAEMSPCSFEQGKAEVKGITRRPRFVMKPNIRPGPTKPTSAAPKHKVQSSLSMPDASPAIIKSSHTVADDTVHHPESESFKSAATAEERSKAPNLGVADGIELITAPSTEKLQPVTPNEDSVDKCSNACTDTKKSKDQLIVAKPTESTHPAKPTDSALPCDKGERTVEKPDKVSRVESTTSVCHPSPEQGDTRDGSEVDSRETASEFDASVSECLSLDADKERGAEIDEEVKKHKRRRSKKQRAEPLPSREKSPDRQKMKMSDLLSWNPQQNFLPKKVKKNIKPSSPEQTGKMDEEESNQSASLPAPQVMIGPDGSVILNTESLLIPSVLDESKLPEAIEEDDDDKYLNTNSYRKHKKTKFWTEDETERFFLGLSMCGTDFSLMTNLLTNRSRRELKNKFHREERCRRPLIDKALAHRRAYDPAPFLEMVEAEEEKAKKLAKKKLKAKAEEKKEKKAAKSKTVKKRKKSYSENEEDDWKQMMLDEEDDDLVDKKEQNPQPMHTKRKKSAADKAQSPSIEAAARKKQGLKVDKDNPQEAPKSTESIDVVCPEDNANRSPCKATLAPNTIQCIPGSSQVQIEMEGVNNPVQGVLIPKSMIPLIAPQLGIPTTNTDFQVLLVQEQSSTGNLVHVYIIPDSEGKDGSAPGKTVLPGAASASAHRSPVAQTSGLPLSLPSLSSSHEAEGQSQGSKTDMGIASTSSARQHCQEPHRTQASCSTSSSVHISPIHRAQRAYPSVSDGSESHVRDAAAHDSSVPSAQTHPQVNANSGVTCKNAKEEVPGGVTDLNPKRLIIEEGQCEEDRYTLTSL